MIATQKSVRKKVLNSLSSVLIIFIVIASVFAVLNFIPIAYAYSVKQVTWTYCNISGTGTVSCTLGGIGPLDVGDVIILTIGIKTYPLASQSDTISSTISAPDNFTLLGQSTTQWYYNGYYGSNLAQIWSTQVTSAYSNNNYQIPVSISSSQAGNNKQYNIQITAYVVAGISPIPPNGNVQTNFVSNSGSNCSGPLTQQSCYYSSTSVTLPSSYFAVLIGTGVYSFSNSLIFGQSGWTVTTSLDNTQYSFSTYATSSLSGTSTNFYVSQLPANWYGALVGAVFIPLVQSILTTTITQTITSTITQTVTTTITTTTTLTLSTAYTLITSTVTVTSTNFINQLISYPNISTFQFWFWPLFMWLLFAGLFVAFGRMANADSKAFIILIMLGLTFGSIVGTLMGVTPVIFIPIFSLLLVLALWKLH